MCGVARARVSAVVGMLGMTTAEQYSILMAVQIIDDLALCE